MKVNRMLLFSDVLGKNKIVFKVPVYQKNYYWSNALCNKLFCDILKANEKNCQHFLGTIIYIDDTRNCSDLNKFIFIDGYQRIITIYILLKALYDASKDISVYVNNSVEGIIFNKHCDEKYKVKLELLKNENEQLMYLLKDRIDKVDIDSNIYKIYKTFINLINNTLEKGLELNDVLNGIKKLEIVEIILDKTQGDNPQKIFESINSTGLELSSVDFIRNYLLMDDAKQNELYEEYWLEIEKNICYRNLEDFFIKFLNSKTSKFVNSKNAYNLFKDYCEENNLTHEDILKELLSVIKNKKS